MVVTVVMVVSDVMVVTVVMVVTAMVMIMLLLCGYVYGCGGSCPLGRLVHRRLDLRLAESLLVSTAAFPPPSGIPIPPDEPDVETQSQ